MVMIQQISFKSVMASGGTTTVDKGKQSLINQAMAKHIRVIIKHLNVCIAIAMLSGCANTSDEVLRVPSPNGVNDVVVMESSEGATTSYSYHVCVVPKGNECSSANEVAFLYGALRNKTSFGVNVAWKNNDHLEIRYLEAKEARIEYPKDEASTLIVELISGFNDLKAKDGAMSLRN